MSQHFGRMGSEKGKGEEKADVTGFVGQSTVGRGSLGKTNKGLAFIGGQTGKEVSSSEGCNKVETLEKRGGGAGRLTLKKKIVPTRKDMQTESQDQDGGVRPSKRGNVSHAQKNGRA